MTVFPTFFWQELHPSHRTHPSPPVANERCLNRGHEALVHLTPRDTGAPVSGPGVGGAGGRGPRTTRATLDLCPNQTYQQRADATFGQCQCLTHESLDGPTGIQATASCLVPLRCAGSLTLSWKSGLRLTLTGEGPAGLGQLCCCPPQPTHQLLATGTGPGVVTDAWLQSVLGESSSG